MDNFQVLEETNLEANLRPYNGKQALGLLAHLWLNVLLDAAQELKHVAKGCDHLVGEGRVQVFGVLPLDMVLVDVRLQDQTLHILCHVVDEDGLQVLLLYGEVADGDLHVTA